MSSPGFTPTLLAFTFLSPFCLKQDLLKTLFFFFKDFTFMTYQLVVDWIRVDG